MDSDEDWELSPEVAHANARRWMKAEYFWDICDEGSPFGNDTGADTLEFFRELQGSGPTATRSVAGRSTGR